MDHRFQPRKQYNDDVGDEEEDPDVMDYLCDCLPTRAIMHLRILVLLIAHLAFHVFVAFNYVVTNLFLIEVCRVKYQGEAAARLSDEEIFVYRAECDAYEEMVWSKGPTFVIPVYIVLSLAIYCTAPVRLRWWCTGAFFFPRRRCESCWKLERTIGRAVVDLIDEQQRHVVVGAVGAPEKLV